MYVYVVTVERNNSGATVSQEGYKTLAAAQKFIENRADKPKKLNDYCYESDEYDYEITGVRIV